MNGYARGSLAEMETQLMLACRQTFIGQKYLDELLHASAEIGRMIAGLQYSLQRKRGV